MSRVGKKAIDIPENVSVLFDNEKITVKGKYGILEQKIIDLLNIEISTNKIQITRKEETSKAREFHGLSRALIQNMVLGVNEKFSKTLIAEGVGYKFQKEKQ